MMVSFNGGADATEFHVDALTETEVRDMKLEAGPKNLFLC